MQIRHSIRASRAYHKDYIEYLLEEFTSKWIEKYNSIFPDKIITAIEFGKQDIRGAPSITLVDDRNCVPHQRHFNSYPEMLAFIQGVLVVSLDYI